ncbi:unnamed protein product [Agarophyton chilense]
MERGLGSKDLEGGRLYVRDAKVESYSNIIATRDSLAIEKEKVPNFSLDEFVRLFIIIRDDDLARKAIKRAFGSPMLFGCGTDNEDTEMIHVFSKVMGDEVSYDTEVHIEKGDEITRGVPFAKKRRRSSDSIVLEHKMKKLVDITTSSGMVSQRQKTEFDGSIIQKQLEIVRAEI